MAAVSDGTVFHCKLKRVFFAVQSAPGPLFCLPAIIPNTMHDGLELWFWRSHECMNANGEVGVPEGNLKHRTIPLEV